MVDGPIIPSSPGGKTITLHYQLPNQIYQIIRPNFRRKNDELAELKL
jgi:hypothetical protein